MIGGPFSVGDTSFELPVELLVLVRRVLLPHLAHTAGHSLVYEAILIGISPGFPNESLMQIPTVPQFLVSSCSG
jgi:hypothetical protein